MMLDEKAAIADRIELFGQKVQLIDLSRPLEPTPSEPNPPRVRQISHRDCAEMWQHLFGIPSAVLPAKSGFAGEIDENGSLLAGSEKLARVGHRLFQIRRPALARFFFGK